MKYKALILDLDGTVIPNKIDGLPSKRVIDAIEKASKILHVGVATSRPIFLLDHLFEKLKLSGPSIINGGPQIIDPVSKKIIWEKILEFEDIKNIYELTKEFKKTLTIHDDKKNFRYSKKYIPKKPLHIWIEDFTLDSAEEFIKIISHISTIASHKTPSWQKNKVDLLITHALATKQHAIFEVAKILNIKTHEIIGVGDGYNDFPLLMACGLKIAMGNAVEDLKEIADYIAPPVEKDGVADVINKFILNQR